MKRKLYRKFFLFYFMFLVLSGILFFSILPGMLKQHFINQKAANLQQEAKSLASCISISGCDYQNTEADTVLNLLNSLAQGEDSEIWLTNQNGRILMCTRLSFPMSAKLTIPGFSSLTAHKAYWMTGNFQGLFRQNILSVIAPVTAVNQTTDYVIIHYAISQLTPDIDGVLNICLLFYILLLLASLMLPLFFISFFYRPLVNIIQTSTDYANRSLNHILPVTSDDEFSHLSANLNYMAQEINQSGEYQRKFISNISHDFRSPLTSIKGYAEALLDGTIPKEDQEKYLNIILSETERLTQLTRNMLTLNNFDDRGTMLNITVFDINEVIRNVAAFFEIQCRKKDMKLYLSLSSPRQNVKGDKEKIQQVLYNLLDNAIKFSYNHSSIRITTSTKRKYAFISIKDSGEGISKENLPKIWDRFYKSDSSRGRDKRGTGLGLAIVKEIIQAHEQNINVISTEGVGTEFIFTLDKA
ncbi:MAG: HAMP domain-containing sensor histidine kinase [Lachnospiraceae bacterium]|nr:HAMP domain-containing sensor histidine kinase [Lachnospiraceae bacterium]